MLAMLLETLREWNYIRKYWDRMDNENIKDFYEFCTLLGELKRQAMDLGATISQINEAAI